MPFCGHMVHLVVLSECKNYGNFKTILENQGTSQSLYLLDFEVVYAELADRIRRVYSQC